MIIYKDWFVIFTLAGALGGQALALEAFDSSLAPSTIQPGEHAVLKIRVPLTSEEEEESISVEDSGLFNQKDLAIIEKTSQRTPCCLEIKYEITGYQSQPFTIPPVQIKTVSNSFSTEKQTLTVQTHRDPQDEEIREGFDELNPPLPLKKWFQRCAIGVLILLAFLYLKQKLKRLPKIRVKPALFSLPPKKEDPLLWLRMKLEELKRRLSQDPHNPDLVDEWSWVLRKYLSLSHQVPASAWTTTEIQKLLKSDVAAQKLIPALKSSDHFKFAFSQNRDQQVASLVGDLIKETESHLILCGN